MRTLSAELTTAQQSAAYTPYVSVAFSDRDNATTLTYTTTDSPNRILRVRTANGLYGESLYEVQASNGLIVPIACEIIMRNSDGEFTSRDLRGNKVEIGWGFNSYISGGSVVNITGTKTSPDEPFFIFEQRDDSLPGELTTTFRCISAWFYLSLQKILGESFGDTYKASNRTIRHILLDTLTFDPSKVFIYDDSLATFTDKTVDITDSTTDVAIEVETNDILYIGVADDINAEIDRITIELATEGVGTWTLNYEYSLAASWGTLSNVDDQTVKLTDGEDAGLVKVPKVISFDKPSNWVSQSVNGQTLRWIRLRFTASTVTTKPEIKRLGVNRHWGLQVDDSDGLEVVSTLAPEVEVPFNTTRYEILRLLMDYTQSGLVMGQNYFKMKAFDNPVTTIDYTYNLTSGHTVFIGQREQAVLVPNRIIATNVENTGPSIVTQFTASAEDTSSQDAQLGIIIEIINDASIQSAAEASARAARKLARYQQEVYQGEFQVPMNIGQEPWDGVRVTDQRINLTVDGRCGRIIREYNQLESAYSMLLTLGLAKSQALLSLNKLASRPVRRPDHVVQVLEEQLPPSELLTEIGRFGEETLITQRKRPFLTATLPTLPGQPAPPNMLFDLDAGPYSPGVIGFAHNYQPPKLSALNTLGFVEKEAKVDVLRIRDFTANGYNDVLLINGGNGSVIFEDQGSGSAVLTMVFNFNLVPTGAESNSIGSGTLPWAIIHTGSVRIYDDDRSNHFTLTGPSNITSSTNYTVPTAAPTSNGQVLSSTTGGAMSWTTVLANPMTTNLDANGNSVLNANLIEIEDGASGASEHVDARLIVEANDASAVYIHMLSPNTAVQGILFGDPEDNDVGWLRYDHAQNQLEFRTNGSTHITIDSAGVIHNEAALGDTDYTIFQLDVTGNPKIFWDESESSFSLTGIIVGDVAATHWKYETNTWTAKDNSISHPFTVGVPTNPDTFGRLSAIDEVNNGGFYIEGYGGSSRGIIIEGNADSPDSNANSSAIGVIELDVHQDNGSGGKTVLTASQNMVVFSNAGVAKFVFQGDGDAFADGTWGDNSFDLYNDAILARDFNASLNTGFSSFIAYNRDALEQTNLVRFSDNRAFINVTKLHLLWAGAVWQLHERIRVLEEELAWIKHLS